MLDRASEQDAGENIQEVLSTYPLGLPRVWEKAFYRSTGVANMAHRVLNSKSLTASGDHPGISRHAVICENPKRFASLPSLNFTMPAQRRTGETLRKNFQPAASQCIPPPPPVTPPSRRLVTGCQSLWDKKLFFAVTGNRDRTQKGK